RYRVHTEPHSFPTRRSSDLRDSVTKACPPAIGAVGRSGCTKHNTSTSFSTILSRNPVGPSGGGFCWEWLWVLSLESPVEENRDRSSAAVPASAAATADPAALAGDRAGEDDDRPDGVLGDESPTGLHLRRVLGRSPRVHPRDVLRLRPHPGGRRGAGELPALDPDHA